jgi:hypothetical protein
MANDEQKLLRYFMEQTEKRFDKVDSGFAAIHTRLDGLNEFKIKTIVSTRWVSGIISAAFGLVTLSVSVGTSVYLSRMERQALIEAARIEQKPLIKKEGST